MKIHPQILSHKGLPAFVVLPFDEYEKMLEILSEVNDMETIQLALADTKERFPLELVEKIAAGNNAIKIFREYRGISQNELAEKIGVTRQYIYQIENGERVGTTKVLKKIASVLSVDLDELV
ncbi:MAG: helix-turn-helix domain-containing protein [Gammaproteobacteria bacterium]